MSKIYYQVAFLIAVLAVVVSNIGFIMRGRQVAALTAQLAAAQPKDDGAVVYVWPTENRDEVSLDRITWTDEKGRAHVWACGEMSENGTISRYGRLVGINRVGWPIAEIANIIK